MRTITFMAATALSLALAGPALARPAPFIAAAVADKARPAEDTARDALRKPAEMLAFAGVRPGMKIGELFAGGGYFTRVFAKAVGPKGKVYAWAPAAYPPRFLERFTPVTKAYANVTMTQSEAYGAPEPLDVVWTSQNYHDLHLRGATAEKINAEVFKALKPGGVYVIVDHRAAPGTSTADTDRLHRIDEATVITEVLKAGFVLDDESMDLRRTDDDHTVSPGKIHDRSDQFVLKFRKPRR